VALLLHIGDYDFGPFECIAAAPPSIFSVSLVYLTREVIKSVVVDRDMIPRTSVANVDKLIHEIVSSSTRSKAIDFFTSTYAKERKDKLEDLLMNDDKDRHFAPGTLLAVSTQETEAALQMSHTDFERIMLHSEMTADHLISRYEDGVARALDFARQNGAPGEC